MPELVSLLPIIAIALLFWFLIIRPAQRRQKALARMQSELAVGERVMLTSGILGTLTELRDDSVMLQVADGVVIEVARGAVAHVVREESAADNDQQANDPNDAAEGI